MRHFAIAVMNSLTLEGKDRYPGRELAEKELKKLERSEMMPSVSGSG